MSLALKNEYNKQKKDTAWLLGICKKSGTVQCFISFWLMEYFTENHRQTKAASCFSKGLFLLFVCFYSVIPPRLWGPALLTIPFFPIQMLLTKSLLMLFLWGPIEIGEGSWLKRWDLTLGHLVSGNYLF